MSKLQRYTEEFKHEAVKHLLTFAFTESQIRPVCAAAVSGAALQLAHNCLAANGLGQRRP